jgi:pilus assembly protein Flp/PilA
MHLFQKRNSDFDLRERVPMQKFSEFLRNDKGATAIEYGLIAAATGLGIAAVMPSLKTKLTTKFTEVSSGL